MLPKFVLGLDRNFFIFLLFCFSCKSIESFYLSASELPEDEVRNILHNTLSQIEAQPNKRSNFQIPDFRKLELSSTAQYSPPTDWITNEDIFCSGTNTLQFKHTFRNNNSSLSKVCNAETPNVPRLCNGYRVFGMCPWELHYKELDPGTVPPVVFEPKCFCDGYKCAGGIGRCVALQKVVTVFINTKPDDPTSGHPAEIPLTVGCLCIQRPAPLAYNLEINPVYYRK